MLIKNPFGIDVYLLKHTSSQWKCLRILQWRH